MLILEPGCFLQWSSVLALFFMSYEVISSKEHGCGFLSDEETREQTQLAKNIYSSWMN